MRGGIRVTKKISEAQSSQPTAIDLFCGAGGLTLGLKQAGFKVLAGVEIVPLAARTYTKNHPDVTCLPRDIRDVSGTDILEKHSIGVGKLDLLAGCPPCQGFSTLRTRNKSLSVDDTRNDLLFEFLRLIDEIQPKSVMMENVPTLARDARMSEFLARLSDLGYCVDQNSVRVENAADYGVPQRRRRMILLVSKSGPVAAAPTATPVTVRECFGAAKLGPVGSTNDPLHDHKPRRMPHVEEIIRSIPKDGGSRSSLPDHLVLDCHRGTNPGFRDVYGRMSWDKVAPTITSGCGNPSKGRYLHPEEDRAISLREAALLQTFPPDYYFDLSEGRGKAALMIGNALPPEFIKRHAAMVCSDLSH